MVIKSFISLGLLAAMVAIGSIAPGSAAQAQEVFRASWTIQDKTRGLNQDLARNVIERANDWLTRYDADAPTARLDDPLRVTVIGEISPSSGLVHARLRRLVLGTIVIDTSFGEFLDTATISSLVRRDHYWRDEEVVVYNESLSPIAGTAAAAEDSTRDHFDKVFDARQTPRIRLGLDESTYRLSSDVHIWAGLGFEEMSLPDFSYGRARIGLDYSGLKIWGEIPAALGSNDNAVLARGLEGAYGLGLSFEDRWVGGALSIADISQQVGTPALADSPRYYLAKSALVYGVMPIQLAMLNYMPLRVKLGVVYHQAQPVPENGDTQAAASEGIDRLKVITRLEFAALASDGSPRRKIALGAELFGNRAGSSITASYQEQILPALGVRVAAAAHGLFGERDRFLPPFSISISPIISIW